VKVSELVPAVTAALETVSLPARTSISMALTALVDLLASAYILPENSSPKSLTPV
jgi:hypothetical protein